MAQGPYEVGNSVRVVDQNSQYRNIIGIVRAVSGIVHQVRLDGFGQDVVTPFNSDQLRLTHLNASELPLTYDDQGDV